MNQRKKLIDDLLLMDDDFSELVFQSDKQLIEHVLQIIQRNDELEVLESRPQFSINNPTGRHVCFEVRAKLGNGELSDIEFQNANDGFLPYRAEFNLALLNSLALGQSEKFDKLLQTYMENPIISFP